MTKPRSLAWMALSGTTSAFSFFSPASVTSAKKPGLSSFSGSTHASTSTWRVVGSATRPTW